MEVSFMKNKSKRNKARQLEFENFKSKQEKILNLNLKKGFGGELQFGRRKEKRPLSTTLPMHLVLKSESVKVFTPSNKSLKSLIYKTAEKYSIKIYELALNHNHMHFILKLKTKESYNHFIRELTSKMAVAIRRYLVRLSSAGSKAALSFQNESASGRACFQFSRTSFQIGSSALDKIDLKNILAHRPFTRIIDWGRAYKSVVNYIRKNILESVGGDLQKLFWVCEAENDYGGLI